MRSRLASPFHCLRAMRMPMHKAPRPNCHASLLCSAASLPNQLAGMTPWAPPTTLPCTPCTCRPSLACTFTTPLSSGPCCQGSLYHCPSAHFSLAGHASCDCFAKLEVRASGGQGSAVVKMAGWRSHAMCCWHWESTNRGFVPIARMGPSGCSTYSALPEPGGGRHGPALRRRRGGALAAGAGRAACKPPRSRHRRVCCSDHASDCPAGAAPAGRAGGRRRPPPPDALAGAPRRCL